MPHAGAASGRPRAFAQASHRKLPTCPSILPLWHRPPSRNVTKGPVDGCEGSADGVEGSADDLEGSVEAVEGSVDGVEGSGHPFEDSGDDVEGSGGAFEGSLYRFEGSGGSVDGWAEGVQRASGKKKLAAGLMSEGVMAHTVGAARRRARSLQTPIVMSYSDSLARLPVADLIRLGHQAIENALADPAIVAGLGPAYPEAALNAALGRLAAFEEAARVQTDRYGIQIGATHAVDTAWQAFHRDVYMPQAGMARIVLRDEPGTLARLGLDGEREDAFGAWLRQVDQFYGTLAAEPAIAARLAPKGISPAELTAARALFEALRDQERGQEDDKGEAQQSTRDRETLRDPFERWLGEYRDSARILLSAHPDWLERLGFLARSEA